MDIAQLLAECRQAEARWVSAQLKPNRFNDPGYAKAKAAFKAASNALAEAKRNLRQTS